VLKTRTAFNILFHLFLEAPVCNSLNVSHPNKLKTKAVHPIIFNVKPKLSI
jgi:hypothetical protein